MLVTPGPTRLLISVRTAREARLIADLPVGVIDVKEPRRGALGCPTAKTLSDIRRAIADGPALSVALGELTDPPPMDRLSKALPGFHFAKLGLAGALKLPDWTQQWRDIVSRLPPQTIPVAVAYADWRECDAPPPERVLAVASELNCGVMLFDTFDKTAGDLFHWIGDHELTQWIERIHRHEMLVALAGSLAGESLDRCLELQPDFMGVRGAVCRAGRSGTLCRKLAAALCARLTATESPAVV